MAFDFSKAFEFSEDGASIENGVHFISGAGVPVHAVTNPAVYFRTNGEIYTNDLSGWTLFSGSGSSPENFSYHKIVADRVVRVDSNQHMITTAIEIDGFFDLEGGLVFI